MTQKHTDLLPCPFCGGEPKFIQGIIGDHYVECQSCRASSHPHRKKEFDEIWNTRADSALKERLAEAERLIEEFTEVAIDNIRGASTVIKIGSGNGAGSHKEVVTQLDVKLIERLQAFLSKAEKTHDCPEWPQCQNTRGCEHGVVLHSCPLFREKQEKGEWIEWNGGRCPIPDARAGEYEIRYQDKSELKPASPAATRFWETCEYPFTIIAYRLIKKGGE